MKDKILFSDRRFDTVYEEINKIFDMPIEGFYRPPRTTKEAGTGKHIAISKLLDDIRVRVENCRHKLAAARYSLALIENEVNFGPTKQEIEEYSEMIKNKMFPYAELMNEVLINETESFVSQVRGNLDIIVQLLKYLYPYIDERGNDKASFKSDRRAGETTADFVRKGGNSEMAEFFDEQIDTWIQNLNELRNNIVHRSALKGFTCFVYESGSGKVVKPLMPDNTEVLRYCQDIYNKLLNLYKTILDNFVSPELKRISDEPYL